MIRQLSYLASENLAPALGTGTPKTILIALKCLKDFFNGFYLSVSHEPADLNSSECNLFDNAISEDPRAIWRWLLYLCMTMNNIQYPLCNLIGATSGDCPVIIKGVNTTACLLHYGPDYSGDPC